MDGKPHENGNTVRGLESWVEESRIPKRKRVQAPAALSFYRSCADVPNDGFCPQSGPVQREFYMPPTGGYTHRREAAIPQPSATKWLSNLRTLRPIGPVNLKNLSPHNPSTQPAAPAAPLCALWAPPLNLLNPLNPHAEGVSARAARRPQRRSSCTKSKSIFLPKPCVKSGRQ